MKLNKCKYCGDDPHYSYGNGIYTVYCSNDSLEECTINDLEYDTPMGAFWNPDFEDILKNTWNSLNPAQEN